MIESARHEVSPEDFSEGPARELARELWSGDDPLAGESGAAAIARELLSGGDEGFDWSAEAQGAVRMFRVKGLERERRDRRTQLSRAQGDEAGRLMAEIDAISKQILELKQ